MAYFKSIGVWSEGDEVHHRALVRRQAVLGEAWQAHLQTARGSSDFVERWYVARAAALRAAGFEPVWLRAGTG